MKEPKEVAIEALGNMLSKLGPDAKFPGDAIWLYSTEHVESGRKTSVFRSLVSDGYIAPTGMTARAVSPERKKSPMTEYRFGPALIGQASISVSASVDLAGAADHFLYHCKGRLQVEKLITVRLISSLLSKRFLILSGLAGSGKTKLAQAFARWLTPLPEDSKCYELIAVGADWSGNENILGYPDGLIENRYVSKPALDVILRAANNPGTPHLLILDEMNLSHVERYFSDILSAIESDEAIHLHQDQERKTACEIGIPSGLKLPKNLLIIGTVNVDETTYMFSPKVLDRANVIEFRLSAEDLSGYLSGAVKPDLSKLDGAGHAAGFGGAFVAAANANVEVPASVRVNFDAELLLFFGTLQAYGAEFGYRTAHEAARFMHFYGLLGKHASDDATWFSGAFDCVILQKLLPKLHGSRAKLGPLLKALWFLCITQTGARGGDALKGAAVASRSTDKNAEPSADIPAGAPYPLSAEKIARMWRLLRENGFASFAEA